MSINLTCQSFIGQHFIIARSGYWNLEQPIVVKILQSCKVYHQYFGYFSFLTFFLPIKENARDLSAMIGIWVDCMVEFSTMIGGTSILALALPCSEKVSDIMGECFNTRTSRHRYGYRNSVPVYPRCQDQFLLFPHLLVDFLKQKEGNFLSFMQLSLGPTIRCSQKLVEMATKKPMKQAMEKPMEILVEKTHQK